MNEVDTFVKEKEHIFYDKKTNEAKWKGTILPLTWSEVRDVNTDFKDAGSFKVFDLREVVVLEHAIENLIENGYLEEYKEKFLS